MNNHTTLPLPIIIHSIGEKNISLSDGVTSYPIFIGGKFIHNGREFVIKDIDMKNQQLNINGRWYHKSEFEPAEISLIKQKRKKKSKGISL